jgi:hypothetical protein
MMNRIITYKKTIDLTKKGRLAFLYDVFPDEGHRHTSWTASSS